MSAEFIYDDLQTQQMFVEFAKFTDKNLHQIVREEFILLIRTLVKLTPPKTKGAGSKAIDADLRRLFRASQKLDFTNKYLKELARKGNTQKLANAMNEVDTKNRLWIARGANKADHEKNRGTRGRVQKNPRRQFAMKQSEYNRFAREKKEKIGLARAGWLPKNGGDIKAPKFLTKNASGIYSEKAKPGKLEISITNTIDYISELDDRLDIVQRAIDIRKKAIAKKLKFETRRWLKQKKYDR